MSEVEDGVADQLPRTVIGGLATTVGPDDIHVALCTFVLIPQQVVRNRGLAQREHVRVFEQQQRVGRAAFAHLAYQIGLEVPDLAVGRATQPGGSYERELVHLRDRRIGPGDLPRRGQSPWRSPFASARRIPRA